jgi:Tetracyclin repressor-like, C-terminal domain
MQARETAACGVESEGYSQVPISSSGIALAPQGWLRAPRLARHGVPLERIECGCRCAGLYHSLTPTPELHKIVLDLAPRLGVAERTETFSRAAAQAIEVMLRKHADEIAPDIDIVAAATIIETLLEALAHRAVSAHPVRLESDLLAREATRLINSYLTLNRG